MKDYKEVKQHWVKDFRDDIEHIYLLEDGTFFHERLVGDYQTCIQGGIISQDDAEKEIGHIISNNAGHFNKTEE